LSVCNIRLANHVYGAAERLQGAPYKLMMLTIIMTTTTMMMMMKEIGPKLDYI